MSPPAAGGTVEFFDGATSLGTSPLAGGLATFQTASLGVGSHSITGVYSGDAELRREHQWGRDAGCRQGHYSNRPWQHPEPIRRR